VTQRIHTDAVLTNTDLTNELIIGLHTKIYDIQCSSVGHEADDNSMNESCQVRTTLQAEDRLLVPHSKRISHTYITNDEGVTELCIYYGIKEVTFDEARLFPFGEALMKQTSFIAESATSWGPGYQWPEIRSLLEALVDEGIVKRSDSFEDQRGTGLVPSLLPPSECPVARSWSTAECEAITSDLGGRAVEIGYLEAIVPVYRVAHSALDGDGRQVGEANVYPPGLRLDRETEWRVCQYPGSRYRDDAPMNVTALRAMIKHWKPIMTVIVAVRDELHRRLERARTQWTIGDLHTFSVVVMALPAFQLMKRGGASPQIPLHPVLSSMFRITDGVRMTTHEMLFLSAERTRSPEETTNAAEFYAFAERNGLLLSNTGVCAGPKALIDEFLTIVFDGAFSEPVPTSQLAPDVRELLEQLPEVVDYAFYALQVWALMLSSWLAMSRAYKTVRQVFEASSDELGDQLRTRISEDWAKLEFARIADDTERDVHHIVYADAYEQAWRGLRRPVGVSTLAQRVAPCPEGAMHIAATSELRAILSSRLATTPFEGIDRDDAIGQIVDSLVLYIREQQAILRSMMELQGTINTLLDRPDPKRLLSIRDLRVNDAMSRIPSPYIFDTLAEELGFMVEFTVDDIDVVSIRAT
jgi:hypothetical protein